MWVCLQICIPLIEWPHPLRLSSVLCSIPLYSAIVGMYTSIHVRISSPTQWRIQPQFHGFHGSMVPWNPPFSATYPFKWATNRRRAAREQEFSMPGCAKDAQANPRRINFPLYCMTEPMRPSSRLNGACLERSNVRRTHHNGRSRVSTRALASIATQR